MLVRLSLPGVLGYVRVARLTASAVAAPLGFDVEEIEDLRVAIDELASVVVEAGEGAELSMTFLALGGQLVIEGSAPVSRAPQLDALTRQILRVVVDEYSLTANDGMAEFRAVKRVASAS